jgi:hypothetical protein
MRWSQIQKRNINEGVEQTIMLDAFKECKSVIKNFIKSKYPLYYNAPELRSIIGPWEQELDQINYRLNNEDLGYGKEYDKLSERASDLRDKIYSKFYEHGVDPFVLDEWVQDLKADLELALQNLALKEVERQHGPVEKYGAKEQDIFKKNLYFLQHLIVEIGFNHTKYDKPVTGGGHFQNTVYNGVYNTRYSQGIDFSHYLSCAIMLYSDPAIFRKLISRLLVEQLQNELFGEIVSDPEGDGLINKLLKDMLGTYVHEFIHLLQHVEKEKSREAKLRVIGRGLTYIPTPEEGRKAIKKYRDGKYVTLRAGRRGNSDRLGGEEIPNTDRYANYFGTSHEIEAHAGGAAAEIVHEFLEDQENRSRWGRRSERDQQEDLNSFIDQALDSLRYEGSYSEIGSVASYQRFVKDQIAQVDYEIGKPLPKADEYHRKVWRLFMTKLYKALEAFKKPLPKSEWD